jgi:hypothetical protein
MDLRLKPIAPACITWSMSTIWVASFLWYMISMAIELGQIALEVLPLALRRFPLLMRLCALRHALHRPPTWIVGHHDPGDR